MILLSNFLFGVGQLLSTVITIFIILLVARAILSWVSPDPSNPIVAFITNATEPVLYRARGIIPPLGMLDMSVIVVILLLYFAQSFVVQSLLDYAMVLKAGATVSAPTVVGG